MVSTVFDECTCLIFILLSKDSCIAVNLHIYSIFCDSCDSEGKFYSTAFFPYRLHIELAILVLKIFCYTFYFRK